MKKTNIGHQIIPPIIYASGSSAPLPPGLGWGGRLEVMVSECRCIHMVHMDICVQMQLGICMCMHRCKHTSFYKLCTCFHMHAYACIYIHMPRHACVCNAMHMQTYEYTRIYVHTYESICIPMQVHVSYARNSCLGVERGEWPIPSPPFGVPHPLAGGHWPLALMHI